MSLHTDFDASDEMAGQQQAVIGLEHVSVRYRAPRERIRTFKEYAIRLLQGGVKYEEFHALRNVTLDIRIGEVFGIVGSNGAGKSTMLRVVSRVIKPSDGRIWVKGRVAPLLELGAGFHPELSGRENVYLNGTLLGYTRAEIDSFFDEIVNFAEVWDFIDAPLRTYSTGMSVRLGFAVATAKQPDILLVDEVLSVGDERFQEKCMLRMEQYRRNGASIVLVTHDSFIVRRFCDRAAWLDHGELKAVGAPGDVVARYQQEYRSPRSFGGSALGQAGKDAKAGKDECAGPIHSSAEKILERKILDRQWFYSYELPGGMNSPCNLSQEVLRFHSDRQEMLLSVLEPLFAGRWKTTTCIDIGCNQGFFSVAMARQGCLEVLGIDARQENIADAELIRELYDLASLRFAVADWQQPGMNEARQFDIVLMLSLIFWLENPIAALRKARAVTREVLIIETPVAPEISGEIDWGSQQTQKTLHGSFALLDQKAEKDLWIGSLTDLSLCPGEQTLIWLLKHCGFSRVEIVPPPTDAYEQLASGKRLMFAAYV